MYISVLIPTLDRPQQISSCLSHLLKNNYKNFEVIVIDQNKNSTTKKAIKTINSKRIKYFHVSFRGKAKALNFAIPKAKGEILAFTDDDCIVGKNWLSEISKSFIKNPDVVGVLGATFPYQPKQHKNMFCPALTNEREELILTRNNYKFEDLGMGNNMAFKKSLFEEINYFKSWLGVGSISKAGFETEFIYRVLRNLKVIYITSTASVYHDRWQTSEEYQKKQNMYSQGYLSFCSYYLFKGDFQIFDLILIKLIRRIGLRIIEVFRTGNSNILFDIFREFTYSVRGFLLGLYFRLTLQ